MQAFSYDQPIMIPLEVARCPICSAMLYIDDVTEWELETGKATDCGLSFNCVTEPDFDSDEWEDWHNWHWSHPYVYWLPLDKPVLDWFNAHYYIPSD